MIELRSVTKRYGRRGAAPDAVHGIDLVVPAGSVWAIVGPNGAGKSTLLSLILGFIRPTSGKVTIAGDPPRDYLADNGASYLSERFALPGSWRVRDSLRMFAALDHDADPARAIDLLGLAPHLDKQTRALSRGLLQRVGLAQALLAPHALVVLDEPTEGLDPLWRIRMRDVIAQLRAEGRTVLLASHDLAEVERVADRAVLLENGAVRDILATRVQQSAVAYRIRLATPGNQVAETFVHAVSEDDLTYIVHVEGAVELSERLGVLLGLGGVVQSVEPIHAALEERVRDALGRDA